MPASDSFPTLPEILAFGRFFGRSFGSLRFSSGGSRPALLEGGIIKPQIVLRGLVTLFGGAAKPFDGLNLIGLDTATRLITQAEVALRGRDFLFGSGLVPFDC